ncbi:MAG: hypothetical protein PVJ04_00465 [Gemmatimonadota bacterium]
MRRFPPGPLSIRLVVTSIAVWAVSRAILSAGAQTVSRQLDISPELSPTVLLVLALAVAWLVLLDITRSGERVFAQNLGIAPLTVMGLAFGTVAFCETVLALAPALLSPLLGR